MRLAAPAGAAGVRPGSAPKGNETGFPGVSRAGVRGFFAPGRPPRPRARPGAAPEVRRPTSPSSPRPLVAPSRAAGVVAVELAAPAPAAAASAAAARPSRLRFEHRLAHRGSHPCGLAGPPPPGARGAPLPEA